MPIVRPYKLTNDDEKLRLVIAASPAQAIRHVSSGWKAEPASPLEVARLMGEEKIVCEDATLKGGNDPADDAGADAGDEQGDDQTAAAQLQERQAEPAGAA